MKFDFYPFIQRTAKDGLDIHSVLVRQHNEVLGQFHWWDGRRDNIHSCSKSVVSLAAGLAIDEGLLSPDEKIVNIFPAETFSQRTEYIDEITVRHLLTMSVGHDNIVLHGNVRDRMQDKDWVHYALAQPLVYRPGTQFVYNNAAAIMMARSIQLRAHQTLLDYLRPRLFDPLDIPNPQWFSCPLGYTAGTGGLFLSVDEMSRIGQLCLNGGAWQGKQLVPAWYIAQAAADQISTVGNSQCTGADGQAGYGYFFWRCARENAYRCEGIYGQFILILPEQDAIITVAAHKEGDRQPILDAVWDALVPQLNT